MPSMPEMVHGEDLFRFAGLIMWMAVQRIDALSSVANVHLFDR